ncbi:MAG: oligopeptide/dipeptide ABC transporter ATP-binding protein [Thermovirgaceae bacterium]
MTFPAIALEEACVRFAFRGRLVEALCGVSLEVAPGDCLALIGESGSGKTTALRAGLAFVPLAAGRVILLGVDLRAAHPSRRVELRRRCGYIPQDPFGCLPPALNALEAVAEPLLLTHSSNEKGEIRRRAQALLDECGLGEKRIAESKVSTSLSGGQRQRVSIARALAADPRLILADEPTSMQDASTRGKILEILLKRVKKGAAMVLTTHDLHLAAAAATQGMVLYQGHVVETGPAGSLLQGGLHPYTRALAEALPRLGKKTKRPPVVEGTTAREEGACPFAPRCPERFGQCREAPPLVPVSGARHVACWKVKNV